jgi:hypothetical protein
MLYAVDRVMDTGRQLNQEDAISANDNIALSGSSVPCYRDKTEHRLLVDSL